MYATPGTQFLSVGAETYIRGCTCIPEADIGDVNYQFESPIFSEKYTILLETGSFMNSPIAALMRQL